MPEFVNISRALVELNRSKKLNALNRLNRPCESGDLFLWELRVGFQARWAGMSPQYLYSRRC